MAKLILDRCTGDILRNKIRRNICSVKYCTNKTKHPKRTKIGGLCHRCAKALYKSRHPDKYFYQKLRGNAQRRGKKFNLTFNEFLEFCNKTGYLEKKGKNPDSYCIDRIDNSKGYSYDNIRVVSLSINTLKRNYVDHNPYSKMTEQEYNELEAYRQRVEAMKINRESKTKKQINQQIDVGEVPF